MAVLTGPTPTTFYLFIKKYLLIQEVLEVAFQEVAYREVAYPYPSCLVAYQEVAFALQSQIQLPTNSRHD